MPTADLAAMTARVRSVLEARGERHRHRRRGGEALPGARGGVFTQKITPNERILAAVLYQRGLCSQDTLAELFEVSRRTIGNVIREVGPALTQDGYTPALRYLSRECPRFGVSGLIASVSGGKGL